MSRMTAKQIEARMDAWEEVLAHLEHNRSENDEENRQAMKLHTLLKNQSWKWYARMMKKVEDQ